MFIRYISGKKQSQHKQKKNCLIFTSSLSGYKSALNIGMTFKEAVSHLRTTTNAPQTTIYSYWLRHIKNLESEAFKVRDAQVWEMYKTGSSDQEISKAVELSTRQVQRIIREKKKKS